jgi:hypothetical protein
MHRRKSVIRRRSLRKQLQAQLSNKEEMPTGKDRSEPEEIVGNQVEAILSFLQKELDLDPSSHCHSLFSYAFEGTGDALEERRSVAWVAQPMRTLTDDIARILDLDPDWSDPETHPALPWEIDLDSLFPNSMTTPTLDVTLEIPNTNFFRTCGQCEGRGTCRCTACRGEALVLCTPCNSKGVTKSGAMCDHCQGNGCKTCEQCRNSGKHECGLCHGQCYLRLCLVLKSTWVLHRTRLLDTNGYPLISEKEGDLLKDVDACFEFTHMCEVADQLAHSNPAVWAEVQTFSASLRTRLTREMQSTSWIRSFQFHIRLIPLYEMIYKKKIMLKKTKIRYLVCGHQIQGVVQMENASGRGKHCLRSVPATAPTSPLVAFGESAPRRAKPHSTSASSSHLPDASAEGAAQGLTSNERQFHAASDLVLPTLKSTTRPEFPEVAGYPRPGSVHSKSTRRRSSKKSVQSAESAPTSPIGTEGSLVESMERASISPSSPKSPQEPKGPVEVTSTPLVSASGP